MVFFYIKKEAVGQETLEKFSITEDIREGYLRNFRKI